MNFNSPWNTLQLQGLMNSRIAANWLELEGIMLSEVSQKKDKHRKISLICGIQNNCVRKCNVVK